MEAIPRDLAGAALAARARLDAFSRDVASAGAGPGNGGSQSAMAGAAREAIFADALVAAIHARLQELKSVAK